jgi:hypothetical protein
MNLERREGILTEVAADLLKHVEIPNELGKNPQVTYP